MSLEEERANFEKWCERFYKDKFWWRRDDVGDYAERDVDIIWFGWKLRARLIK